MRYRRLSYRYTMVVPSGQGWPFQETWESERLRFFVAARWRPDADLYETAEAVEIVVDLAGVDEDDFEVKLFDDALVVQGHRQLPAARPMSSRERARRLEVDRRMVRHLGIELRRSRLMQIVPSADSALERTIWPSPLPAICPAQA